MLSKRFRITGADDYRRAYQSGQSWSDRILVVCKVRNGLPLSRFGFSVSRRVGNATVRNRVKRRLREVVRLQRDVLADGWDVVFIARRGIVSFDYGSVERSVGRLLSLAQMYRAQDANSTTQPE